MKEIQTGWGRSIGWLGVAAMVASLAWAGWVPGRLGEQLATDRVQSRSQGLQSAPAPNMPGRLDGNSVGNANNQPRALVVEKWSYVGEQITSGSLSRIPSEAELELGVPGDFQRAPEEARP